MKSERMKELRKLQREAMEAEIAEDADLRQEPEDERMGIEGEY